MPQATIIFVPGAWHRPEVWRSVALVLEDKGYKCFSIKLATASSNGESTFLDDLNITRNAILEEMTRGRSVVVVAHSYGAWVGCSAIKGLTRPSGTEAPPLNSKTGYVAGLVLVGAGYMPSGKPMSGFFGGSHPIWDIDYEKGLLSLNVDPKQFFYHDLPPDEQAYWVSRLVPQSLKSITEGGEHVYAGWMDVPSWYILTLDDVGLPAEVQRASAQAAQSQGARITIREISTSHSPMLSRPVEFSKLVAQAVADFM